MSERPIPSDIWDAARALRNTVIWESNDAVRIIARALMARDEQCAQYLEKLVADRKAEKITRGADYILASAAAIRARQ